MKCCGPSYLTYIKLCTLVKRNESMAHTLQAKLKVSETDENKRGPRPQDLIRLYDIILQVTHLTSPSDPLSPVSKHVWKQEGKQQHVQSLCNFSCHTHG